MRSNLPITTQKEKSDDNKIGSFPNDIVRHDISALWSNYEFEKRTGIHKHMMTGEPVCTACLLQGIESPLTESDEGWQCNNWGCDKFYLNPNYNPPDIEDMDDNPTDSERYTPNERDTRSSYELLHRANTL